MDEQVCDWRAVRYEGRLRSGRTKPLLLDVERRDAGTTNRMRCVTKARGCPEVEDFTLCHEFLGSRLARLFGLRAPQSELVWISAEFIEANRSELLADGGLIEPGVAVGVEHKTNLLPFAIPVVLDETELFAAARLFAFDLLVQNPDRRVQNPNCARSGGEIIPYDFEMAFGFRLGILKPEAWRVSQLGFAAQHLFFGRLRGAVVDWDAVFGPLREVSPAAVAEACGTLPEAWSAIGAEVLTHLRAVAQHWSQFETEVQVLLEIPK